MSGPQGSDPNQSWQPPGKDADQQSADQPTQVARSDRLAAAAAAQEATWQAPAYTPPRVSAVPTAG